MLCGSANNAAVIFVIISANVDPSSFLNYFAVKFKNKLQRKLELSLSPPFKSVATW